METSPFAIEGPALVSFSGGRTSAYMLRRILDDGLRPDVHVVFADTGKERAETYRFIREVERFWAVPVTCVTRPGQFTQLITEKRYLPNPVARFCTEELKMKPLARYMTARGYDTWTNVIGFRADEPRRVAIKRQAEATAPGDWVSVFPLHEAGVTKPEIRAFWQAQPFDLQLRDGEGNCDLCFLKAMSVRQGIIRDHPELATWWVEQERRIGATFRPDSRSYAQLLAQPQFPEMAGDLTAIECHCTD